MRSRLGAFVLVGAILVVLASCGGADRPAEAGSRDEGLRDVSPPALEPGPQLLRRDSRSGSSLIGRATLSEMVHDAEVVFTGRVVEIGAREVIARAAGGQVSMTGHPVRFSVERVLRGPRVVEFDVTNLDGDARFPVGVGREYLVFAKTGHFGDQRVRRLVPVGYYQGVYEVVSPGVAENSSNGTVELADIEQRLDRFGG